MLLLTISLQLVASYNRGLPITSAFLHFIIAHYTFVVLEKPCQGNFEKCQEFGERSGGSEKYRYFLKIIKWQHKIVRDYKRGKVVSYVLNNAAKTCLYKLKISENNEIDHVFQSKASFHLSGNFYTSCFNAFNAIHKSEYLVTGNKLLHFLNEVTTKYDGCQLIWGYLSHCNIYLIAEIKLLYDWLSKNYVIWNRRKFLCVI